MTLRSHASNMKDVQSVNGTSTPVAERENRTTYSVNFTRTGTNWVWLRMCGFASSQKTARAGFDDGNPLVRATTTDGIWRWRKLATQINVETSGIHELKIHRKDAAVEVDKIVVTPGSYKPAAQGPAESPRG